MHAFNYMTFWKYKAVDIIIIKKKISDNFNAKYLQLFKKENYNNFLKRTEKQGKQ